MTIKDTVRNLARQYPFSIPNLEKELGFGTGTISRWDKSFPGVDKMQAVADFFGVTVDYLLGRETGTKKSCPT